MSIHIWAMSSIIFREKKLSYVTADAEYLTLKYSFES